MSSPKPDGTSHVSAPDTATGAQDSRTTNVTSSGDRRSVSVTGDSLDKPVPVTTVDRTVTASATDQHVSVTSTDQPAPASTPDQVVPIVADSVPMSLRTRSTLDILSLACSLPHVNHVFEKLPQLENRQAHTLAVTLLSRYKEQGEQYTSLLNDIAAGKVVDPRDRALTFALSGGTYGVVQQGTRNTVNVDGNLVQDEDVSIMQQGVDNTLNINVSIDALSVAGGEGYRPASTKDARESITTELMRFVQRFSRGGGLGSQQDHSSPVTGTPVDDTPGEGDANDRGNYTVRPSSLFSLGQNCKQVMERMLGLGDASPVKVSNVQALGEDRIRITLTEKDPAPAYLGKAADPSTLVILKLRGPLHEFDQKKDLFRLQTAGLLGCLPDAISFIQATRSGSVRILVAMPTSCYARLLQLALFQPSVLRALGIFWLQPVCFPASINVAEAVDVTTVTSILGRACCHAICDSLYDAYQISADQRVGLSSLSLVSHLHDRLLDAQIPADKVVTATNEAHAKLARCLDDIRHASPDGADDGSGQHRQCIAELLALEFETGRAHRGVDISAVAKTVLQSFLGSRDVHLLSASARSTGSSDNTHSVSFLQLASPSYRPISTEAKEALRLDTHALSQDAAAALSASLAKCLAQLCAVQASNVSVCTLPQPQASAQPGSATVTSAGTTTTATMTGASAPGRFLAILPAMLARYIGEQCRNKDSEVYKTLAQHGVLSVNRLRGPQITLSQSGASRSSIGQSLRRVFSRLGRKNTSGQDVVDAISARREEIVNYHFPSVTTAARFHLAGLRTGDIGQLNIAVVGMQGAGKSSLVNMLASVVSQSTQSPCHVATTASSDEGCTRYVSPGWHFGGVCLVDTPPMVVSDNADAAAVELEMKLWAYGVLEGRLNHNEDMRQLSDERLSEITECRAEARPLAEQIHGLIIVIDEGKIPLNGDLSASNYPRRLKDFYRKFTKNRLRFRGMEPLVVVTNCAKHPSEMYIDAVVQLSRAMHGSRFFLDNQLGKERQYSDSMQLEALEILSVVTNHAELFILRRQQLEKQQREDATITDSTPLDIMLSKTLSSYGFNKNRLLTMAQTLQSRGINSKRGLLDSWDVARSAIGSNTVLFDKLQEEMRRQHGLVFAQ